MADSYVCSGAKIKCSCGDKISTLTVFPSRTVSLTRQQMANISDHISMSNIAPFGKCHNVAYPPTGSATAANHGRLTPMPCMPGTISEWNNGKNDYFIKGKPALLKSSYCRCRWGGIITITVDGQIDTGHADLSKVSLETEEQWEEKNRLSPEEVLDGIQLALDAAGFVPGFGAIPDLLNAAISALRGDWPGAGFSLLAAVPGIGDIAAAAKVAQRGTKMAKAAKTAKEATKVTEKTTGVTKTAGKTANDIGKSSGVSDKKLAQSRTHQMNMGSKGGNPNPISNTATTTPKQPTLLELTAKKADGQATPKTISDTVITTPSQPKLLEATAKKTGGQITSKPSDNAFNDLTKGDQFEIENVQVRDYVQKSQEPSSWNSFTVKENPPGVSSKIKINKTQNDNVPSPESVIKDNKMNKYGDFKPKPDYGVGKKKVELGKNLDIEA